MSLTLHFHPLSSYCWKVLIGLYELDVPFTKHVVDLGDADARAALAKLWPLVKFPVLHDAATDRALPESSIILEYVDREHRVIPDLECRLRDRIYDSYIHAPMQAITADRLRPAEARDPLTVARATALIEAAYPIVEGFTDERFTIVDCAAFPALYYANRQVPIAPRWPQLAAYLERLQRRPSIARVLDEAAPYLHLVP